MLARGASVASDRRHAGDAHARPASIVYCHHAGFRAAAAARPASLGCTFAEIDLTEQVDLFLCQSRMLPRRRACEWWRRVHDIRAYGPATLLLLLSDGFLSIAVAPRVILPFVASEFIAAILA